MITTALTLTSSVLAADVRNAVWRKHTFVAPSYFAYLSAIPVSTRHDCASKCGSGCSPWCVGFAVNEAEDECALLTQQDLPPPRVPPAVRTATDSVIVFKDSNAPDNPATPTLTSSNTSPTDLEAVTLTCATSTPGMTNYQFFHFGTRMAESADGVYTMAVATIGTDDGVYTCVAKTDTVASKQSPSILIAMTPQQPTLTVTPPDSNLDTGIPFSLVCSTLTMTTSATTYQFFRCGSFKVSQPANDYRLTDDASTDSGIWVCTVTINAMVSSYSTQVSVKPPVPTFTMSPPDANIMFGTVMTIECNSPTYRDVGYRYLRNGNIINISNGGDTVQIQSSNTFAATPQNSGSWTCIVTVCPNPNPVESSASLAHDVLFGGPEPPETPSLSASPSESTLDLYSDVTLTCLTATAGVTSYTFLKDGVSEAEQQSGTFEMLTLGVADGGSWSCTAANETAVSSASNEHSFTVSVPQT